MQQNFFDPEEHLDSPGVIDPSFYYNIVEDDSASTLPVESDLSDTHEDGLAASTEAFTLALTLMNYRDKIVAQNGLGLMEVTSIEQHVPGLLRYSAPQPFTYETSKVNMQWSLEAIDEKIKGYLAQAGKVFEQIIDWIIARLGKLRTWYQKSNFGHKIKYMQTMLRSKSTVIGLSEARNYMGGPEFDAYWKSKVAVEGFNSTFKTDLNVEDMNGLRTGGTLVDVVKILSNKKGSAPHDYNDILAIDKHVMSCIGQTGLIAQKLEHAKILFNPALANTGVNYSDKESTSGVLELPKRVTLAEGSKTLSIDEAHVRKLFANLGVVEKNVTGLKRNLDDMTKFVSEGTPESIAAFKKFRADIHDSLRNVQTMSSYCSDCLMANYTFINTAVIITGTMTKGVISKAKGQTNG